MNMNLKTSHWRLLVPLLALLVLASNPVAARERQDHRPLKVCADPGNLPFSNLKGEGFDNRIARVLGDALGRGIVFYWRPSIERGLTRRTLKANKCDVLMGMPVDMEGVLTTIPYYRTTYVFVYPRDADYRIRDFDDPLLTKLKIGVYQFSGALQVLLEHGAINNLVIQPISYNADMEPERQPVMQIQKVVEGRLDMAAVWGPFGGYYAHKLQAPVTLQPVNLLPGNDLPLEFDIALAVRPNDHRLRDELNAALERESGTIRGILEEYGVPLLRCDRCVVSGELPSRGLSEKEIEEIVLRRAHDRPAGIGEHTARRGGDKLDDEIADLNEELANAVASDDLERARMLVDKGGDVNHRDKLGNPLLVLAARFRSEAMTEWLVSRGAEVDAADSDGWTAAMFAALRGSRKILETLSRAGADLSRHTNDGRDALMIAIEEGNPEMVTAVLDLGGGVNAANEAGNTPLMLAIANGDEDIFSLLLSRGADINAANKAGITPLMVAAANGRVELVRRLLQAGADPDARTETGMTALSIARQRGHDAVSEFLGKGRPAHAGASSRDDAYPDKIAASDGHGL